MVSTSLGIGYIGKGGGTIAAVVTCLCLYGVQETGGIRLVEWLPSVIILLTGIGVISASEVEHIWGKDDQKVVIDEVAGMCMSMVFLPVNLITLSVGLIFFRFFDIVKPLYIRKAEKLKGGWGVMTDDLLAGLYANILLHVLLYFRVF